MIRLFLLFFLFVDVGALTGNFTVEESYNEEGCTAHNDVSHCPDDTNQPEQKFSTVPSIMKGRGMVMDIRSRAAGTRNFNPDGREGGIYIYLRQFAHGQTGQWRQSAFLFPDDPFLSDNILTLGSKDNICKVNTRAMFGGIYISKSSSNDIYVDTIMEGRQGIRLEYDKFAVTGNPETTNAIMVSAFGVSDLNSAYNNSGAAYVFTGEYYHWTQASKLTVPIAVDDGDYHFGRCVSIDKQTQDTAAISCPGCDPGSYKTGKISLSEAGSQGRGAVFIYRGSEGTGYRQWTATQMLWPRHNKWYYFGGGFLGIDGNTMVTDVCKGAECIDNTFIQREFDAPMTDLFVYVKQEKTGLWSEQQVLTDSVMETERNSKSFMHVVLHDDTIAYGNGLVVKAGSGNAPGGWGKVTKNIQGYAGQVMIWYPNKPNYQRIETFRHKADASDRRLAAKPDPSMLNQHQWSLQQYLRCSEVVRKASGGADVISTGTVLAMFGKYVSLSGDRMLVGMRGKDLLTTDNPFVVLYTRQRQGGMWSQQQIMVDTTERAGELYGVTVYNSHAGMTGGQTFIKYMSEMANDQWSCLLVTMFDEFGDGWDTARLRVDAPDGTYDYYYPTCDAATSSDVDTHPNPLVFQYCPSMREQGGMYKFYMVDAEKAKFNWEIEWSIQADLGGADSGSMTNITGDIHTEMSFYWNPMTVSFSMGSVTGALPATVSCSDCPVRGDGRRLLSSVQSDAAEVEAGRDKTMSRGLRHAAHTASPTVSPAPTMAQSDTALAEWEQLVMTTSDPLEPWFSADRTGTYFYLSDISGRTLLRKDTQCFGSATPLTHSCWLNYPDSIPDGEYIARIGGARAGVAAGLHTWHFCGVAGGQSEHLQFRVQHGSCYPVQRFTTARYCTFKQGSEVLVYLVVADAGTTLSAVTAAQEKKIYLALSSILPHTKQSDFSITDRHVDDASNSHLTIRLKLRPGDHGLDPADFEAISDLESMFRKYVAQAEEQGVISSTMSTALGADGGAREVTVDLVAFDTAEIAAPSQGELMVEDDDGKSSRGEGAEVISRDWLQYYTPASGKDKSTAIVLTWALDAASVLGYVALAACVLVGAKRAHESYSAHRSSVQKSLREASFVLHEAGHTAAHSGDMMAKSVHGRLDSFSDSVYALMQGSSGREEGAEPSFSIPEVVLPDMDDLFASKKQGQKQEKKQKKPKEPRNVKANETSQRISDSRERYDSMGPDDADENMSVPPSSLRIPIDSTSSSSEGFSSSSGGSSSSESCSESSSSGSSSEDETDLKDLLKAQRKAAYPTFKAPKAYTLY